MHSVVCKVQGVRSRAHFRNRVSFLPTSLDLSLMSHFLTHVVYLYVSVFLSLTLSVHFHFLFFCLPVIPPLSLPWCYPLCFLSVSHSFRLSLSLRLSGLPLVILSVSFYLSICLLVVVVSPLFLSLSHSLTARALCILAKNCLYR